MKYTITRMIHKAQERTVMARKIYTRISCERKYSKVLKISLHYTNTTNTATERCKEGAKLEYNVSSNLWMVSGVRELLEM
jgi:hypothetical protein